MSSKTKHRITQQGAQRRDFLIKVGLGAGALALPAVPRLETAFNSNKTVQRNLALCTGRPFTFSTEPRRQRKSFYDLKDSEVRLLSGAIGYMRNGVSIDNDLQWDRWVVTHARHCTETKVGQVDQVHWSWFFLPWHRAYLWFLERQLAHIITTVLREDGTKFALPYWDWIEHKEIPNTKERESAGKSSPLFGYDLTKENMVGADELPFDNLALWDGYRKPSIAQPTMDPGNEQNRDSKEHIEETIEYMSPAFLRSILLVDFEDFAGKAVPAHSAISTHDGMGLLEHYPHNNGHDWVGTRFGQNRDMGKLRYAALDPMFFMHHANIDRLWTWYGRTQPDPDTPWGSNKYVWGKQCYSFTDIDGSPVTITVSDIIKRLTNVTYAEPESRASTRSVVGPTTGARSSKTSTSQSFTLSEAAGTLTTKPLTLTVMGGKELSTYFYAMGLVKTRPLSLLTIETGPISYAQKFTVKVFIDKPDANREASIHDSHYVGRIRILDSAGRSNERGTEVVHTFSLLISPDSNFYDYFEPEASFPLTLVVVGVSPADEGFSVRVIRIGLKIVGD